jgi:hypothetical protein
MNEKTEGAGNKKEVAVFFVAMELDVNSNLNHFIQRATGQSYVLSFREQPESF